MKGTTFGFLLMLLLAIGTPSFIYLAYSSNARTTSNPGFNLVGVVSEDSIKRRNLIKVNIGEEDNNNDVQLEDYGVIDPVPSTTTSIRPGPIQHGTPLLPFIPEPSPPPTHPDQLDFP
ncbi:hypothetical protein MIMGU_mgv1a025078mg [Erythranthe guttata]|uniref:Uncharacterized protein n=1 Tax=Erythranthe guttata TaxID=4155 RepID=A0A022R8P6_ERYGU|nr:hypothetical protein MIMGU_mgv1a025078mg [Erythranthe guttata]